MKESFLTSTKNGTSPSIKFASISESVVVYKYFNGNWKEIYPVNNCSGISNVKLNNNTLSYTISDNSECDGDSTINSIYDPIVIGAETTTTGGGGGAETPPSSSSGGGGGGCTIAKNKPGAGVAVGDILVFLTPLAILFFRKKRY